MHPRPTSADEGHRRDGRRRRQAADGLWFPCADDELPGGGDVDGGADGKRDVARDRSLLRCDARHSRRDRQGVPGRMGAGGQSPAARAAHRRGSARRMEPPVSARARCVSGGGRAGEQVLPARFAHRRRVWRPEPDLFVRTAGGICRVDVGYRCTMSDQSNPGLGDLFSLFGGPNPFGAIGKSVEQFKRGVNEFARGIENFNATMENLNAIAGRINGLLDEVEEPIRAFVPQMTRSIKAADAVITQISGPIDRVTPGINRLAETLSSPVFNRMPKDIAAFLDALGDMSQRMQPLSQMAESAGNLFGLRSLGGALRAATPARTVEQPQPRAEPATAKNST